MSAPPEASPVRIDVAIAIVMRDDRILICQRHDTDVLAGYWEFPGGKRQPGETDEQCLMRELAEELAISVRIAEPLPVIEYDYPHARVRLHPFLCKHLLGEPQPLTAKRLVWVPAADLPRYRFPPANDDLIRTLIERFSPPR
jgi:mutator protein MutT